MRSLNRALVGLNLDTVRKVDFGEAKVDFS